MGKWDDEGKEIKQGCDIKQGTREITVASSHKGRSEDAIATPTHTGVPSGEGSWSM